METRNPVIPTLTPALLYRATATKTEGFFRSSILSSDGKYWYIVNDSNTVDCYRIGDKLMKTHLYYDFDASSSDTDDSVVCEKTLNIGESIYDFQSSTVQDYHVAVSSKDHPIQLFNHCQSSDVTASYLPINHLDELDATFSVAFNSDGKKIVGGGDQKITMFDIDYPGRNAILSFSTCPSKSILTGVKGMISTIQFNRDFSGLFACGSYKGDVGIYSTDSANHSLLNIKFLEFGVNYVRWSPCGRYLWIGGRNSDRIECWDIRGTKRLVGSINRSMFTNQRTVFDIDPWGQYVLAGSDDGLVHWYDAGSFSLVHSMDTGHRSAVNSCHFHPYSALMLTTQGQRSFPSLYEENIADADAEVNECKQGHCASDIPATSARDDIAALLGSRKQQLSSPNSRSNEIFDERLKKYSSISVWSLAKEKLSLGTFGFSIVEEMTTA